MVADAEEDTLALREALHEILQDECTEVLLSLIPQMGTIIDKYGNAQAITTFNASDH